MGLLEFNSPKTASSAKAHFYGMLALAMLCFLAPGIMLLAFGEPKDPSSFPMWFMAIGAVSIGFAHIYRVEYRLLKVVETLRVELAKRPS